MFLRGYDAANNGKVYCMPHTLCVAFNYLTQKPVPGNRGSQRLSEQLSFLFLYRTSWMGQCPRCVNYLATMTALRRLPARLPLEVGRCWALADAFCGWF